MSGDGEGGAREADRGEGAAPHAVAFAGTLRHANAIRRSRPTAHGSGVRVRSVGMKFTFVGDRSTRAKTVGGAIRTALAGRGPLRLAIAYVAGDLKELLGVDPRRRRLTLLCDAWSGACNPYVLRDLAARDNVRVLDVPGLHAKVMIADDHVVIGSANASGAAIQGGKLEALAVVRDAGFQREAARWFDGVARTGTSLRGVLGRPAEFARLVEKWRRQHRPSGRRPTLLEALEANEPALDGYIFALYKDVRITPNKAIVTAAEAAGEELPDPKRWDRYEDVYERGIERVYKRRFEGREPRLLITFKVREVGKRLSAFLALDANAAAYVSSFRYKDTYQSNFQRLAGSVFELRGADAKALCKKLTLGVAAHPAIARSLYERPGALLTAAELRKLLVY